MDVLFSVLLPPVGDRVVDLKSFREERRVAGYYWGIPISLALLGFDSNKTKFIICYSSLYSLHKYLLNASIARVQLTT